MNEAHEAAQEAVTEKLFGAPEAGEEAEPEVQESDGLEEQEEVKDVREDDGDQEQQLQEADEEPALHEVVLGDNLYEVPLEIKEAIDKSHDYTQKTQAVSEQRKQAEVLIQRAEADRLEIQFVNSVSAEVGQAEMLKAQIEQWRQHKRDNIDNLSVQEIVKIDANIEELTSAGQAIAESVKIKHQEFQQAAEQAKKDLGVKSTEALRSKFANWNDATKAEVKAYGASIGFTEAELDNAVDPREWEVLYKASLYDKLQAGKKAAISKVQTAPIKPKARRSPAQEAQTRRLNQRKAIKNAKSEKERHDLIQDDMSKRLGLT